ncbi:MAG: UDP-N-acetylmuramate dehydrogenase [Vampirovibrionia bacterium]
MIQNCLTNKSLSDFTTYKIGGKADKVFLPETKAELIDIIQQEKDNLLILGYGSNILVSSQGYAGCIILTRDLNKISMIDDNTIYAEAGAFSPKFAKFCLDNNLTGGEFLAGIPGSIGGAVCMNSSANSQKIEDIIISAEVYNINTNEIEIWQKEKFNFKYRESSINSEENFIISAKFKLNPANKETILSRMNENLMFRKNKQPSGNNAGSVFKNPENTENLSAGYLLDQASVKGWNENDACVSSLHANFIINNNNASSLDISRLINRMQKAVKDQSGYTLNPEIKFIGIKTEEEELIWKNLQAH